MVYLHVQLFNCPLVHFRTLVQKLIQPPREWAAQYSFTVLWYPDKVVFQSVGRVCSNAIRAHTPSMPGCLRSRKRQLRQ